MLTVNWIREPQTLLYKKFALFSILLNFFIGFVLSFTMPYSFVDSLKKPMVRLDSAVKEIRKQEVSEVIIINTSGFFDTIYPHGILRYQTGKKINVRLLSSCNGILSLKKESEDTFVLSTDRDGWLSNMFSRLVRTNPNPTIGQKYTTPIFTATILELSPSKKDILKVRFQFFRNFSENFNLLFLSWNGEEYIKIELSSLRTGKVYRLADTSDVWKSL